MFSNKQKSFTFNVEKFIHIFFYGLEVLDCLVSKKFSTLIQISNYIILYANVKSLCSTPETDMLYVSYSLVNKSLSL